MDIRYKLSYFLLFSIHVFYGMQEKEKSGYRTKRVGKNLYYACIKGRIRGILKYA